MQKVHKLFVSVSVSLISLSPFIGEHLLYVHCLDELYSTGESTQTDSPMIRRKHKSRPDDPGG